VTGQALLDRMELLNQELQLHSGESDVTRGLLALNAAQDHFESLVAVRKNLLGSLTGTVATAASTETSTFPAGVLRIDKLVLLNASNRPKAELDNLKRTGGHAGRFKWPLNLTSQSTGEPSAYWTNGTSIYWDPLPGGVYTVRWYGFQAASDISAGGTFAYPDIVALPLASFAVKLFKLGLEDATQDISGLALETFKPVIDTLSLFNRDGSASLEYTEIHTE
jgi:hypothetical protein